MKSFLKKPHVTVTFCLLIGLIFSGCVSNILKEKIPAFSDEISYQTPDSNFNKIKSVSYPSWKNSETQNVIMILSSCDNTRYPVTQAYQILAENLENVKVEPYKLSLNKITRFDSKKISATLDQFPVEIRTFSFEHHNCLFLSSLSGKPQTLDKDIESWKKFLNQIELKK